MSAAGEFRAMVDHAGLSRPALALLGLILVLMALSGVTLWRTTAESNGIDSERSALALRNAVASESAELLAIAADNAQWDDAATALYDGEDLADFVQSNYADTSAEGALYDGVVALRRDGSIVFNLRRGATAGQVPASWVGDGIDRLMATAVTGRPAHGLLSGGDGVRLAAVAMVTPTSPDRIAAFRAANPERIFMLFTRPLDGATVAGIGDNLVLRDVVMVGARNQTGTNALVEDETRSTLLRDVEGRAVAALTWQPANPGDRALVRSMPFILMALLTGLLASILLLRRGYASVSEINRIALLDSLSDLPNRRALRRLTQRALRDHQDVALAFIDLDGFKLVNDLYGHGIGDEVIIRCGRIVAELAPSPGGAARLGGDEFALLAYGPDAQQRLALAGDALLGRLREPFHIGDRTIRVGASIGLASRLGSDDSAGELMRRADVAMYVAKRNGKMRQVWHETDHDRDRTDALDIERRLREALDDEEFDVVYQPIIDAQSGAVSGFEGLLRWQGAGGVQLGPNQFIPVAEDTGLIDRLGEFVLRRACRDALDWDGRSLSLNISAAQLRNPGFVSRLGDVLGETGFAPRRLILEITESYVISDPIAAREVIDAVRAIGVRVALDDFGTGYASIGFLRQFAFDILKIDRTLVAEAVSDHAARTMLHSSIALARALNMATIAEGIENEAQAVIMRAAGCDLLQGWHFARESDAEASEAMLGGSGESASRYRAVLSGP